MEEDLIKQINNIKFWCKHQPFFYNNKETFKNKTILLYCENANCEGNETINFFTRLCELLFKNIIFVYCGDIDDFIEKINKFDNINYYFFVEPEKRTPKHQNILNEYMLDKNKNMYLLNIKKFYEHINIEYPNYDKNNFLHDWIRFFNRVEDC